MTTNKVICLTVYHKQSVNIKIEPDTYTFTQNYIEYQYGGMKSKSMVKYIGIMY